MGAYVAACGGTDFVPGDAPIDGILSGAVRDLLQRNPEVRPDAVDGLLVSTNDGSGYLSAILAQNYGIRPKASHSVENLCASGASAVVTAASLVMAGLASAILVVGGDRASASATFDWYHWDISRGEFLRSFYWASIITASYKRRFGVTAEELAAIPAKNHRNAQDNPHACSRRAYSVQDVLESHKITEDLRRLDCCRPCSGASAVLVTDGAVRGSGDPIEITGIGMQTDAASFGSSNNFHSMPTVRRSAEAAYESAGIRPSDVDVCEIHDAFSVCEPIIIESLGMAEDGRGAGLAGDLYTSGDRSINPRGGIIASGHPSGATGVAQVAEVFVQLQSRAGNRQVRGARIGLAQNMAAAAKSSYSVIMEA